MADSNNEKKEAPRRSYRQADEGIDAAEAAYHPSGTSRPTSRPSNTDGAARASRASKASAIDDRLNEKQRARGPRPTRPGAVAKLERDAPSEPGLVTTATTVAPSRTEQDARAKGRARRPASTDTAPGAVMERKAASVGDSAALDQLEEDAMAKAIASRPGAVSSVGGNQTGKSSGRSSHQSALARRTASYQSESGTASVGAVSASGGSQQGKASGRSAAQSQAASLAAVSSVDQRSISLGNIEADVIAKGRARGPTGAPRAVAPGVSIETAHAAPSKGATRKHSIETPNDLKEMHRVEADVLSKQVPPSRNRSTDPRAARPTATALNDDGFGDATVYQPQQDEEAAFPVATNAAPTTAFAVNSPREQPDGRAEMALASSHTYAGIVSSDAGPVDNGIEAFVADTVLDALGVAVVMSEEEEEKLYRKKYRRYIACGVMCFLLLLIAIVVPVAILSSRANRPTPRVPTSSPSAFPTMSPSLSPTSIRFDETLTMLSTKSGAEVFEDKDSPQYKAATWVSDDDLLQLPLDSPQFLQRYYLASFYFALGGDNWEQCGRNDPTCGGDPVYKSWLLGEESECTWLALKCDDGVSIDEIFFRRTFGNNLNGTLPLELSYLTDISNIIMANNAIVGTIPTFLGSLTKLTALYLLGNRFNGTLSDDLFSSLSVLRVLQLGFMQLSGTVPHSLTALNLVDIRLENNQLTGTLPALFGSLPSLEVMELQENQFTGSIPDEILGSATIASLRLYKNGLTGSISTSIGKMIALKEILIGSNSLTGKLPTEIFTLPNIVELNVSTNLLTGTLSDDFAFLPNTTRRIALDNNKFTGSIPSAFDVLPDLNHLSLDHNMLTGTISQALCDQRGEFFNDLQVLTSDCNDTISCEPTCCTMCY